MKATLLMTVTALAFAGPLAGPAVAQTPDFSKDRIVVIVKATTSQDLGHGV